ncbi:MAG: hypothetical protein JRH06_10785 [Deltaproteobacteria bacterium]|nr:hypothetical protein [Deltaproteobacteria bacterium]MBW2138030.1 hypothetical protein [Deltaproteobacteria bacterium]
MTHQDEGHYARKHPADRQVDPKIAAAAREKASEGTMPCATAFTIVKELGVTPDEVGFTLDFLEIKILKCQLGLYGYQPNRKIVQPADKVGADLEKAIGESLEGGRLSCAKAWQIAEKFNIPKMEVASACETLKVKISPCQLGAF